MASEKVTNIVEELKGLTVLELSELVHAVEDEFGVSAAAAVAVARRAGTTATLDQLNKYFSISQMPVISGRYWNEVHGQIAPQVNEDKEGLQNLRYLARNMAYFLKCKEAGKNAGILPPIEEEVEFTNFIR